MFAEGDNGIMFDGEDPLLTGLLTGPFMLNHIRMKPVLQIPDGSVRCPSQMFDTDHRKSRNSYTPVQFILSSTVAIGLFEGYTTDLTVIFIFDLQEALDLLKEFGGKDKIIEALGF